LTWFTVETAGSFNYIPLQIPDTIRPILSLLGYGGAFWAQGAQADRLDESQQQQAKWIQFGLVLALTGYAIRFIPAAIFPAITEGTIGLIFYIVTQLILVVGLASLPVIIGVSMMRYRLWDVDFYINRSLVYGMVIVTILLVMGVSLLILQSVLVALTGSNQVTVALLIAAIIAGATFQPLRRYLH
jgi:hypothetical protein